MVQVMPIAGQGSCFADLDAAHEAVALVRPMIEAVLARPALCGSGVIALVVMDPARDPARSASDHDFDAAVLHECSFGKPVSDWDANYFGFARAKAALSWRLREPGETLQGPRAHLLREGDSLLRGAIVHDGIVVAASGAEVWYDEAVATAVAAALRAVAQQRHAQALFGRSLVAARAASSRTARSA